MKKLEIFLFSAAILGVQIVWTRIFSFMIWYHFAFLVISIAMLGFSSGGLLLSVKPKLLSWPREKLLWIAATGFAVSTTIGLLIVINLPFEGEVLESVANFLLFVLLIALIALEFFFAGLFISFAIASEPGEVSGIYMANMVGSGLGCGLAVLFLDLILPTSSIFAFALIAVLVSLLLLRKIEEEKNDYVVGSCVALVVVIACFGLSLDPLREPFFLKSTKNFPGLEKEQILERRSNSYAVLDFFQDPELNGLWGLSGQHLLEDYPQLPGFETIGYSIDSWALTFAYTSSIEITEHPMFDYLPASLVYTIKDPDEVLLIGAGGGTDVINALRNGVSDITAVDINPAIIDAGVDALAEYNHGIFNRPEVHPVVAEGRNFLTSSGERKWDVVQLSGVDTLAAGQAGAFSLSENFLYTLEAFDTYLDHINDDGIVTMTRWMYEPPRQTLRVLVLADAALKARGIEDTAKHIVMIGDQANFFSVLLISLQEFSEDQAQTIVDVSAERGFRPLVLPYHKDQYQSNNVYQELVDLEDKQQFIDDYPFDISVTTDDKPFFMEHTRWASAATHSDYIFNRSNGHLLLLATTFVVSLFSLLFIALPAAMIKKEQTNISRAKTVTYFSSLGLGYVLIEIVLVQKLTLYLGNPSYALAVVLLSMLVFSGLGSLLSSKLDYERRRLIPAVCCAITLTIFIYGFLIDPIVGSTLDAPLSVRIALVLLLLSVPAILMGMPFPLAISALGETRDLVVAGWVANGYFSVIASCVSMIFALSFGFYWVLMIGALIYFIAAMTQPVQSVGS